MANGTFTCEVCGVTFEQFGRGRRRKWCSDDCRLRANRKRIRKYAYRPSEPRSRTCEACGVEFKSLQFRKYCGNCPCTEPGCDRPVAVKMRCQNCHSSARQKRKREARDAARMPIDCIVCGAAFHPRAITQKTCSSQCQYRRFYKSDAYKRGQENRKRKRAEDSEYRKATDWSCATEVRRCQWCDHEFTAKLRKPTRFCCQDHYQAHGLYERGRSQSPWSPKWPDVIRRDPLDEVRRAVAYAERDRRVRFVGVVCANCDEAFVWDRRNGGVASRGCTEECAESLDRIAKARGRDRRRARKRDAYVEDVHRKQVYERDGWKCQICGKAIPKRAKVPQPKAATIDHIIPLAAGGTHEMRNVQAAHFICNATKSANAANDQLLLFG